MRIEGTRDRARGDGRGMDHRILITGSEGLIGSALRASLEARGTQVVGLDLLGTAREEGDVRSLRRVRDAIAGCLGVVHLAAVSRVVWGERAPGDCWNTNVGGVRNVLEAAHERTPRPWLLFASSREVYGQPRRLPAREDVPLHPVNVYGRSKVEGERLVVGANARGLRAATVRLSNVYGSTRDHADRVIPAFVRAAISGGLPSIIATRDEGSARFCCSTRSVGSCVRATRLASTPSWSMPRTIEPVLSTSVTGSGPSHPHRAACSCRCKPFEKLGP